MSKNINKIIRSIDKSSQSKKLVRRRRRRRRRRGTPIEIQIQ